MRKNLSLLAFVLSLMSLAAFAQTSTMNQKSEKNVHITQGPTITSITGTSATINWTTDKNAANHVKYRVGNEAWKSAYTGGGSTNHSAQLSGLQPGQTVDWQILTRDGDVRTSGQFQTASTATGTAPDVNASSAANNPPSTSSGAHVPVFRSDNSNGTHVYTTTAQSLPNEVGTGFSVATGQESGTVPLYHLVASNGDSVYTTSQSERSSLIARGYRDEGTLGYIASSQQPGTIPLYRLYNSSTGMHFYTAQPGEVSSFTSQGFHQEGIAGYVWTQ
ncbi:MAG TPA: hypothetical protein VJN64_10090 [Terriglobales bacterium]|nr:hypothetical protein [Terriglobales bacterium]